MRYRINKPAVYSRKMKLKLFFRWFLYFLTLILLYSLMSCGAFGLWQPFFIVSFAIGVSMREHEFVSSIFGIICGFMLDISIGTLFGFFAVFLMPCCFLSSLLSRNLIRVNFVNHIIFTTASMLIIFFMHYLFNYMIWNTSGREIIIFRVLIPSFIATVVTAPLMYFLSRFICAKLGTEETTPNIKDAAQEAAEMAEKKED